MQVDKARCNGRSLGSNKHLNFQPITYLVFFFFFFLTLTYQMLVNKQTYFEDHHPQNSFYQGNSLNQTLEGSQSYLALLLISILLLMMQVLYLS